MKKKVLFICVHNSGRSQIAEVYLNKMGGEKFQAESAGFEPSENINPLVIEVMKEEGFDLSKNKPKSIFPLFKQGRLYDYVITVCDNESEKKCPIFPGIVKRLHWPFPDPKNVEGTDRENLSKVRNIRDMIKQEIIREFSL
ncbi:MAG: arsenate reductase ArsC [Desulfobacterales bacterium]|nr:arsenate reductase ArsC [Desulfobacterales bacterium]